MRISQLVQGYWTDLSSNNSIVQLNIQFVRVYNGSWELCILYAAYQSDVTLVLSHFKSPESRFLFDILPKLSKISSPPLYTLWMRNISVPGGFPSQRVSNVERASKSKRHQMGSSPQANTITVSLGGIYCQLEVILLPLPACTMNVRYFLLAKATQTLQCTKADDCFVEIHTYGQ